VTSTLTPRPSASPTLEPVTLTPPSPEPTTALPTVDPNTPTPRACIDALRYLADVTLPDNSQVSPGQVLEKQWRVENNGTCDWDAYYRLKVVNNSPSLGSSGELALFPARAGSPAIISINFIAPLETGIYQTYWQAFNPQNQPFGEVLSMIIEVK